MRFLRRLVSMNFWYEVTQNLTIWGTLKNTAGFNPRDIRNVKNKYKELRRKNRALIDDVPSEYHVSWCSLVLAIYQTSMEKGLNKKEAMNLTEKTVFTNTKADDISRYIEAALDKSKDPFGYMVNASKHQEDRFFGKTFGFVRTKDDENSYQVRVNRCLYCDYFKKNNAPELMKVACKWDLISWSQGIIPDRHKVMFKRPVTLGLDGKDCVFSFKKIK